VWADAAPVNLGNKSGNVSLDFGAFLNAKLTATANITFNQASNVKKGQSGWFEITQTGGYTLSVNTTYFETGNGSGITLSASGKDIVTYAGLDNGKVSLSLAVPASS
jgi:hypothetical protein